MGRYYCGECGKDITETLDKYLYCEDCKTDNILKTVRIYDKKERSIKK